MLLLVDAVVEEAFEIVVTSVVVLWDEGVTGAVIGAVKGSVTGSWDIESTIG